MPSYRKRDTVAPFCISSTLIVPRPSRIRYIHDLGESGTYISKTKEHLILDAVKKFNIKVVPDATVLLSFKLTVGRVALTDGDMTTNEAIAHFKPFKNQHLSSEYLYLYLREFDYNRLGNTSSIAQAVNSKIIKSMFILCPSSDILNCFSSKAYCVFEKIKTNQREIENLHEIRAALLPKLLSGENCLKASERMLRSMA